MKILGKCCVGAIALLLAISVILIGCGDDGDDDKSASTNEKPDKVVLASLLDLTGPYAAILKAAPAAEDAAQAYINTELDGVDGVPLEMVYKNYGGDLNSGIALWGELMASKPKPMFVMIEASDLAAALKERAVEEDVIMLTPSSKTVLYPAANSFGYAASYEDMFGGFIDWLAANHPGEKMAILTWNNTYGKSVVTSKTSAYAEEKGVDIVATELFAPADVDVTSQLAKIRDKGAQWIYTSTTTTGVKAIIKGGQELDYKFGLCGNYGIDQSMLKVISASDAEGVMSTAPCETLYDQGTTTFNKYFEQYGSSGDEGIQFPFAFGYSLLARDVIMKAANTVGWGNIDVNALKNQMLNQKDFRALDNGVMRFTYSADRRSPSQAILQQFQDGKLISITPWLDLPDLTERD